MDERKKRKRPLPTTPFAPEAATRVKALQRRQRVSLDGAMPSEAIDTTNEGAQLHAFLRQAKLMVRARKGTDKTRIEKISLTNYGKFREIYARPADKSWEQLSPAHQERMAHHVLRVTTRYLESAQHQVEGEKYPRRLKMAEVRNMRPAMLNEGMTILIENITKEATKLRRMRKMKKMPFKQILIQRRRMEGLVNRMKILQGVITGLHDGRFTETARTAERKRKPKRKETLKENEFIPVPRERALITPGANGKFHYDELTRESKRTIRAEQRRSRTEHTTFLMPQLSPSSQRKERARIEAEQFEREVRAGEVMSDIRLKAHREHYRRELADRLDRRRRTVIVEARRKEKLPGAVSLERATDPLGPVPQWRRDPFETTKPRKKWTTRAISAIVRKWHSLRNRRSH